MYQRILVPVDGSTPSDKALEEAIRLARITRGGLRLIHVVDELSFALLGTGGTGSRLEDLRCNGRKILDLAQQKAEAAGVPVETVLHDDFTLDVDEQVAIEARVWRADVIVAGTHGRRGAARWTLGRDAERIARLAPVPVMLVRASDSATIAQTSATAALGRLPIQMANG